jgi:hypothetical protein
VTTDVRISRASMRMPGVVHAMVAAEQARTVKPPAP